MAPYPLDPGAGPLPIHGTLQKGSRRMSLGRRFTRWARAGAVVGFLSALIVTGLLASAGPAQAATITVPQAPLIWGDQMTEDPGPWEDGEWSCVGWFVMGCQGKPAQLKPGWDTFQPMTDQGGGSSSGSWGAIPPAGAQSASGNGASAVVLDPYAVTGNSWVLTVRNTSNASVWVRYMAWQTCGNAAGAFATSLIGVGSTERTMQGNAIFQFGGSCPAGTFISSLTTTPPIALYKLPDAPRNYVSYVGSADLSALRAAVKTRILLDCIIPAGDPNNTMDDGVESVTVEIDGDMPGGFVYPSCQGRTSSPQATEKKMVWEYQFPGNTTWNPAQTYTPNRANYPPECYYTGCPLGVRYKNSPCQAGSEPCSTWTAKRLLNPADYTCWWGPQQRPINQCNVLERAYTLVAVRYTLPNTDGDPTTPPDTPTGGGGGGGGGIPTEPIVIPPGDPADPGGDGSCYPSGLAVLNPIEWVLRPLKCALQWAFVPSASFFPDLQLELSTAWEGSAPGQWVTALTGVTSGLSVPAAGCLGPALTLPPPIDVTMHPFDACAEPMATVRTVLYGGLTAALVVGGGFTCVRLLASAVGYQTGGGQS